MNLAVWKLCRVLANKNRLRILRHLLNEPETCESDIALFLGLTRPSASRHIRLLSECGFIETRPVGKWLLCSTRTPEKNDPLYDVQKTLSQTLKSSEKQIDAIYRSATTFTHERRGCIIRLLQNKSMFLDELVEVSSISEIALTRHLKKLINRRLITEKAKAYRFTHPADPLLNSLLKLLLHS